MGGENGHPHPRRVDGALSRRRSQGRGACAAGALFPTSVFEKGGASFKEPGPVIFASGGFGTDFTLNSMLATSRPDLCTFPQPTVSTATGGATKMGSTAFLHTRLVLDRIRSPGKYRRIVRVAERLFFAHLCWFEANVGPEAVFGTMIHLFQFSLADKEQYFLRPPPAPHQLVAKLVDYV